MRRKTILILVATIIVSFFQHSEHISKDIQGVHSWRQSQTMWNVRNFARVDANILNPRISSFNKDDNNIRRYEFPLMQWSLGMIQRVLGEKIDIIRIAMFLIGVASIFGFYFLMEKIIGIPIVSLISAVLFQYSPLFYYYTLNPIPDNLALCSVIWYMVFIIAFQNSKKSTFLLVSSFFLLVATAVKLPYLMFSVVSIFYFLRNLYTNDIKFAKNILIAAIQLLVISPALVWYFSVMNGWGGNPILLGIDTDGFKVDFDFKLLQFQLTEWIPNLLLNKIELVTALIGFYAVLKNKENRGWILSVMAITSIYLILFSVPIGYIHDYYMLPFLIILYLFVGFGLNFLYSYQSKLVWIFILLVVFSAINAEKLADEKWSVARSGYNNDVFLYSEELKNLIPNDEKCIILNDISSYIFSYKIDKMGYIFRDDYLPIKWIKNMISKKDVRYMYSDSRIVDENEEFTNLVDEIIFDKGSIKVFKLLHRDSLLFK